MPWKLEDGIRKLQSEMILENDMEGFEAKPEALQRNQENIKRNFNQLLFRIIEK